MFDTLSPAEDDRASSRRLAMTFATLPVPARGCVYGSRYAVATDHPYASLAAMNAMQRGGNAADALIAASAVLAVTKPYATQLGGDAFALIWRRKTGEVECLNAGGLAPRAASLDRYANGIPSVGPRSVTVPGLVDAWFQLHQTFATQPIDALLAPAIRICEEGFPVSATLARNIALLPRFSEPYQEPLKQVYLKDGRTPYAAGESLRLPDQAASLRRIAGEGDRDGFYKGETARLIAEGMAKYDGLIDEGDFENELALWHEPIKTTYGGCDVYEQALPSQGVILLEALNIIENFPLREWGAGSADAVHVMVEAIKLAFADRYRYVADPLVEPVPLEVLLSKEHAAARAGEIDLHKAREHLPAALRSDTTSFVVADEDMAIAFIQTVFSVWGSRFLIPGTGILMTNRLSGFSSDPASPNVLAPGKRTVHTLNNFMALRDGELVAGGGTPGADYQVQTNLQTLAGVLTWGLDLQGAVDMPRWGRAGDGSLALEDRFPEQTRRELAARGHAARDVGPWNGSGFSQVIASLPQGGWAVASDVRGEGLALGI
jgi:gamma-glutamyltranspeptidase/glutathione hydrolase